VRYQGLVVSERMHITASDGGLLVRPDVARRQIEAENTPPAVVVDPPVSLKPDPDPDPGPGPKPPLSPVVKPQPKRYYGSVTLDPQRVGRDASRIAEEVIAHLAGLVGARVTVTLDIEVQTPAGVPDNVVSIVSENSRTLKFGNFGFERE
jgi:hypothetical protein